MQSFIYNGQKINFSLSNSNVHIVDSYKVKKNADMLKILEIIRDIAKEENKFYTRTNEEWLKEWKAHNVLYALGIKRSRTGSVDLNENESRFHLFGYSILSKFYRK